MQKFEQLHAEDQIDLVVEALRLMFDGKCRTLEQLITKRERTVAELWREICAQRGYDECKPWLGWPTPPKRDFMKGAPGADRPLAKLLEHWQRDLPHMLGRQ